MLFSFALLINSVALLVAAFILRKQEKKISGLRSDIDEVRACAQDEAMFAQSVDADAKANKSEIDEIRQHIGYLESKIDR